MDYNSYTNNQDELKGPKKSQETKKVNTPVGKGRIKKKNKLLNSIIDTLLPGDAPNIGTYLISDVIVPAIKRTISDSVHMWLYGDVEDHRRTGSPSSRISYTSYNSYYGRDRRYEEHGIRTSNRFTCDDIIMNSLEEAQNILARMDELIHEYGIVSIGDFYDLAGISNILYTDYDYGWTDIRAARIMPTRDGYVIKMPRAVPLKG